MAEAIILVFFIGLFFWIWMIIDCSYHEKEGFDRFVWLIIIFLMNVFGALAYLILRYRANRQKILLPENANDNKQ